jgi:hypothetical protein
MEDTQSIRRKASGRATFAPHIPKRRVAITMADSDIDLAHELQARIGAGSLSETITNAIRAQHRKTKLALVPKAGAAPPEPEPVDPSKRSIALHVSAAMFERLGASDEERAKSVNAAFKLLFALRTAEAATE